MLNKKTSRDSMNNNIREIPGFYYDYEKCRYFPNKNCHNKTFSEYLENKDSITLKNKKIIAKDKENENEANKVKYKLKEDSLFNLFKNSKLTNKYEMIRNSNFNRKLEDRIIRNVKLVEIKHKFHTNKYEFIKFENKYLLFTFDNSEEKSRIIIEDINFKENVPFLTEIREIKFTYKKNKQFDNFKIVNNILILIKGFEIFLIRINELFLNRQGKIYYQNFKEYNEKINLPLTYEWPQVEQINKNEFIFLFYKSK